MATGVKPRDEETSLTRADLEAIQDAMKTKKFRDLLSEYCEEVRDPANQALYQKEMTQLEKERGYDVKFINPKGGYVIKTSVAGDRKAFINICSNDNVGKPSCEVQEVNGKRGMNWQIPYSMIPPREDYCQKNERCVIYDVVFHPDTLRMAEANKQFRELVNKTAFEGLHKTYNIHLDDNNYRFPKSQYKGMTLPAVIRKEDPNYNPSVEHEEESLSPEMMEKLYPQRNYTAPNTPKEAPKEKSHPRKVRRTPTEYNHATQNGYTIPKYVIKEQKDIDLQEFTYHRDSKQHSATPSQIVVEVNLPLLTSTKDCTLDVKEKSLKLISEKPAKYKLNVTLPYSVNDECGNAKFDKSKHKLIVTLPVIRKYLSSENHTNAFKVDSGVESEENSSSLSDEDHPNLVEELSTGPAETVTAAEVPKPVTSQTFFDKNLGYQLPTYTHNVLDDVVAFTFHVKNTEPDSVQVKNEDNKVCVKFTSMGSGFVPVHYAAIILFEDDIKFENASGEAWDNNVILQLELSGKIPLKFEIGLSEDFLTSEHFDVTQSNKSQASENGQKLDENETKPVVEVMNLRLETNIVVSSTNTDYDEDDLDSPTFKDEEDEKEIVWTESNTVTGARSILRKPMAMRSYSESSAGDIASSMDYISSDCIPEESSLKKTVRFSDVIARQFYRYNSSIEGQKKKNQRKKSNKRNQDRRRSESEAEDDNGNTLPSKPRLKSVLKQRRDSGLADTSDAEGDSKGSPDESYGNQSDRRANKSVLNIVDSENDAKSDDVIWESENTEKTKNKVTCSNVKHNTDLYNPDRLNKGQYLEVAFKNDLIFDLDM